MPLLLGGMIYTDPDCGSVHDFPVSSDDTFDWCAVDVLY